MTVVRVITLTLSCNLFRSAVMNANGAGRCHCDGTANYVVVCCSLSVFGCPRVKAGHSAFCLACSNGHTDLVRWFIEDYEHEVAKEFVPMLFECVAAGFVDVVTELLTTGVDALLVDRVCSSDRVPQ